MLTLATILPIILQILPEIPGIIQDVENIWGRGKGVKKKLEAVSVIVDKVTDKIPGEVSPEAATEIAAVAGDVVEATIELMREEDILDEKGKPKPAAADLAKARGSHNVHYIQHGFSRDIMDWLSRCQPQSQPSGDRELLEAILKKFDELKGQITIMANEITERIAVIDANTTRTAAAVTLVAERIRTLSAQVDPEVAAKLLTLADFTGTVATNLEAVAHGPSESPPIDPGNVPPV